METMEKRIFSEQPAQAEPEIQAKQEFVVDGNNVEIIEESKSVEAELILEESVKPPRFWLRVFLVGIVLFILATLAQSVQWLWDSWQAHQWIYFALSLAFFGISLAGVGALIGEWRKLVNLRKHQHQQQISEQFWLANQQDGTQARTFCQDRLAEMQQVANIEQLQQRWQGQVQEGHSAQEVMEIFSQSVLEPLDRQAKKMITKSATENAIIVGISPLAVVDMLFMAWRNIALVNKISRLYGMEMGYFSRLKLFKMVLMNMAFAGVTEIVSDIGMDFFSQNFTAKLSMRAAQGFGVGILTARLGLKAMEFCRPVTFKAEERPKLSAIRQELLTNMKTAMFSREKESEKVAR